ncbi:MAG: oligosaccharide flippase family protein [Candidatus Binataceae bacterium]
MSETSSAQTPPGGDRAALAPPAPAREDVLGRFLRANGWALAARMFVAAGNFVRFIVFARMLRPFDFGVAVSAFVSLDVLSTFTESYMMGALIQQEETPDEYLDTIWVSEISRAILIAAIMIAAAKPLAAFFRLGDLYQVFWMAAVLGLVRELQSPGIVKMFRELEYHNMLILNVVEFAATLGFGVGAILLLKDWRGFVIGVIAGQACWAAASYVIYPYRPRFRFQLDQARRLFRFGKWLSAARSLQFLAQRLDSLAVGHLLGPGLLGAYKMALNVGEVPVAEFSGGIAQVMFPTVARLSKNQPERRRVVLIGTIAVVAAGAAYAVILTLWGGPLLIWFFGAAWIGAIGPLKFLCFYGMFHGLLTLAAQTFEGIGTPAVSLALSVVRLAALALIVYPLTVRFNVSGTACAALISVIAPIPLMLMFARRTAGEAA